MVTRSTLECNFIMYAGRISLGSFIMFFVTLTHPNFFRFVLFSPDGLVVPAGIVFAWLPLLAAGIVLLRVRIPFSFAVERT